MAEGRWESGGFAAGFAINDLLGLLVNGSNVGKISPIVEPGRLVQNNAQAECSTLCLMQAGTEDLHMKRFLLALFALAIAVPAQAQDKLVISIWGGSWRDLVAETVAKKFTKETGVPVEFVTGGTIDRLNKEKLAKGNPESDITFTTSHVGWLYANDGLFEQLDVSKIANAANLADEARISPFHLGAWAYVYTIGYRADLVPSMKFESWADLWKPELKGKLAAPDFDPSHIIAVSALLSGGDAAHWEKGQDKLKALKPNFKAFYTNDANSQQLLASGETPVQIVLSMNAYYMIGQNVPITLAIPKEGAVLGIDTVAIMKGSKKAELAYKFINALYDPEIQAEIAKLKKGSPAVLNAKLDPEVAKLPGVFTTAAQWKQQINIDAKLRAEKTAEWRKWFAENIMN
jgi:putative spermidine/putrescine transport system substrate-binding protein